MKNGRWRRELSPALLSQASILDKTVHSRSSRRIHAERNRNDDGASPGFVGDDNIHPHTRTRTRTRTPAHAHAHAHAHDNIRCPAQWRMRATSEIVPEIEG